MSKTPTPNEASTTLRRLRAELQPLSQNADDEDLIAALDVAIDHLPKPVLADGPYLYRAPGAQGHVRFVRDGRGTVFADEHLAAAVTDHGREIEDPERYEPIIIIRGEGEVDRYLVRRVADRAHMPLSSVRTVLNALIQEVRG